MCAGIYARCDVSTHASVSLHAHTGTKKQGSAVSQTMRKQFKNAVLARTQARKFLDEATSIKEALRELNEIDVDDKPLPTTGAAIKKKKKKGVAKDPLVLEELTWGQAAGQSGLMGLALKNKKSAAAEAKQRDLEQFYMMNSKADAEGEKGFSTRESNVGKDRLQRIEEMVLGPKVCVCCLLLCLLSLSCVKDRRLVARARARLTM